MQQKRSILPECEISGPGGICGQWFQAVSAKPRWHKNTHGPGRTTDADTRDRARDDADDPMVCARCGHRITSQSAACEQDGLHTHSQINPGGFIWNFRCFQNAPGTRSVGRPSSEFSWFPGCTWQIAHCSSCDLHVGWAFFGDRSFYGLISERVIPGS